MGETGGGVGWAGKDGDGERFWKESIIQGSRGELRLQALLSKAWEGHNYRLPSRIIVGAWIQD